MLRCEDATTVPKGLVVLLATTLALVLPLRVVPFVALVDAGDAVLLELLRFDDDDGGEDEDTETERKTRGKSCNQIKQHKSAKKLKMEPNIQKIVEN